MLGTVAFCGLVVVVVVGLWRDATPGRLWSASALVGFGFFGIFVLQYERYAYPALALFLLAALYDRRYWVCYVAVSIAAPLNMIAVVETAAAPVSVIYGIGSGTHNPLIIRLVTLLVANPTTWLIALVNSSSLVLALVWYFGAWRWGKERGDRRTAPGAATERAPVTSR